MSACKTQVGLWDRVFASALIGAAMLGSFDGTAVAQDRATGQDVAMLNPLSSLTLSDAASFAGKPLFSASRRPPPEPLAPTAQIAPPSLPPPSAANLQLIGTVRTRDGTMARVQDSTSGSTASVKPGDRIGGWTVVSIEAAAMELEQSGATAKLELFGAQATRQPVPAAPPAPGLSGVSSAPIATGPAETIAPRPSSSSAPAPPGTVAGTAAAEAAANSTAKLVFGTAPPAPRAKN